MRWARGQPIVRREIWRGAPWLATVVIVVEDGDEFLASYLPEEAPFVLPPSADGRPHPWAGRGRWLGHGVLMLQRPGESYAVWHFWEGPKRRFSGWYLNLQEPYRRTEIGYDTQDLELDIWIPSGGAWRLKDEELVAERVEDGRFTAAQALEIHRLGDEIGHMLDRGEAWWDPAWAAFEPSPEWRAPDFPLGWEGAAAPTAPEAASLGILPPPERARPPGPP